MYALELLDLTKNYGKNRGINKVSLQVEEGDIFGFIGPNGAGKSTAIRLVMQLLQPDSGSIRIFGRSVERDAPDIRREIGYLPSEVNLYSDLNGLQMLDFTARAFGLNLKQTKAQEYAEMLQFDMHKKIKSYSLGNRKKLGIIQSLLHEPKLLILDEPTSGLDPLMQHQFFQLLEELNRKGMTIFFSTHVLSEVEKVCRKVGIIREGEMVRISDVDELTSRSKPLIQVEYEQPGDHSAELAAPGTNLSVVYRGGMHEIQTNGEIHLALQLISSRPIKQIRIQKPTLEQLFMNYYERDREGIQ